MSPAERAKLEKWKAELADNFAARRCPCGEPGVVVKPGSEAIRDKVTGTLLKRAMPEEVRCLKHALPWVAQRRRERV